MTFGATQTQVWFNFSCPRSTKHPPTKLPDILMMMIEKTLVWSSINPYYIFLFWNKFIWVAMSSEKLEIMITL